MRALRIRAARLVAAGACIASLAASPRRACAQERVPATHEVASGLRLWEFPSASDRFCLVVLVEAGSVDEEPDATGLAHLTEHAIFRGTSAMSGTETLDRLRRMDAALNGRTFHDSTTYAFDVPAEHAGELVGLVAGLVVRPAFRQEDVRLESSIVLEELNAGAADLPRHGLLADLYGNHPFGRDIGGSPRHVARFGAEDVRAFHEKHYRAGGVVVAWSGPPGGSVTVETLATAFSGLAPGRHERSVPPARPRLRKWIVGRERGAKDGHLAVGRHVVPDDPEALVATMVFSELLRDAAFRRMRQDSGLTYAPVVQVIDTALAWHVELRASTADASRLRALADAAALAVGDAQAAPDEAVAAAVAGLGSELFVRDAQQLEARLRTAWLLSLAGGRRSADVRASLLDMTGETYRRQAAARLGEPAAYRVADHPSLAEAPPGLAAVITAVGAAIAAAFLLRAWLRRRAERRAIDRELDRILQFRR